MGRAGVPSACSNSLHDPECKKNGAQWAQTNDDRITRVGRFLRKARIDELPQFWNLLVGICR